MARVKFKQDSPIQSLSGSIGNVTFRTINGKTFVHQKEEPVLREGASRQEKAQHKRRMIINECVGILQAEMPFAEALRIRKKMYDRLRVLYDQYAKEIKARTKLQRRMMEEYRARFGSEKSTEKVRKKYGEVSKRSQNVALLSDAGDERKGEL